MFDFLPETGQKDNVVQKRIDMIQHQIINRGVRNKDVLSAIERIPRHEFVSTDSINLAYEDYPLSIGEGQTISQPYIVALMTELLQLEQDNRVLEVGTGSGYQTAVLAELVKHVYSIEIIPSFAERAKIILKKRDYNNIIVQTGNGYRGWPEHSPYDRIIVTAAADEIPQPLVDQLKPGGRLVIPVSVDTLEHQMLKLILKDVAGNVRQEDILAVRFVPLVMRYTPDNKTR